MPAIAFKILHFFKKWGGEEEGEEEEHKRNAG
jgi:hypothetical protein